MMNDLFQENSDNDEYRLFLFDFNLFEKFQPENGFMQFGRILNVTNLNNPIQRAHSKASFNDSQQNESIEFTSKSEDNKKNKKCIRFWRHKQFFLAHLYKNIPTIINKKLFTQQIQQYLVNQNFSLAHFQGLSLSDWEGNPIPTILTERPANGPLSIFIEKVQPLTAEQKYAIICGIADGLGVIHKNGFIHSNLNPTTVYIDNENHPQLVDYIFIPPFNVESKDKSPSFEYTCDRETVFEHPLYIAPEVKRGEKFDSKSDIYSLGMTIFYILTHREFNDSKDIETNFPDFVGEKWHNLIKKCLSSDPENRPTVEFILKNELLDDNKKKEYINSIDIHSASNDSISKELHFYLSTILCHANNDFTNIKDSKISIFHNMIPNIVEIDGNTWMLVASAEAGDAASLECVGDMFMNGKRNLQKDENCASECYIKSAKRGNINAMMKAIEVAEEGFGITGDLISAFKSIENIKKDKRYNEMKKRLAEILKKRRSVILTNVEPKKISELFSDISVKDISETGANEVKVMFDCIKSQERAVEKLNDSQIEYKLLFHEINEISSINKLTKLKRINLGDYKFCEGKDDSYRIGSGTFGDVYKVCKINDESQIFAAKVFKNKMTEIYINEFKRELIIAPLVSDHPAIIKYIGYNEHSLESYIRNGNKREFKPTLITEFIPNGKLEDAIVNHIDGWNNTAKLKAILGIANGLALILSLNATHRDLKPENILLNERLEPVICDLGNSRQFIFLVHDKKTNYMGTNYYKAPELFPPNLKVDYTYEIDSYAFGIIMYQILMDCPMSDLYPGVNAIMQLIKKKLKNEKPKKSLDGLHPVFQWLIEHCWNPSINLRPDAPTIYNRLVEEFRKSERPLLPDLDVDAVNNYIDTLPEIICK